MNSILKWLEDPIYPKKFPFDKVTSQNLEEALNLTLERQKQNISTLLKSDYSSFESFLSPLLEFQYQVQLIWGIVCHLKATLGLEYLRNLYDQKVEEISSFYSNIDQDSHFIRKIQKLKNTQIQKKLSSTHIKVINDIRTRLQLQGAFLKDDSKKRVIEIQQKLALLHAKFSNRVLDATDSFCLQIRDPKKLKGISDFSLNQALKESEKQGVDIKQEKVWTFTLHANSYSSLIKFCESSEIREQLYKALNTRCIDGEYGNKQTVFEILNLRLELSQLVGFKNYVEYSLKTKMADSSQQVISFLEDLYNKSIIQAKKEYQSLIFFKNKEEQCCSSSLSAYDIPFYSERYKEKQFQINEDDIKTYLPLSKVLQGMFKIVNLLYKVEFSLKEAPVWDKTVLFYEIHLKKTVIAGIYFDLHSRKGKQEGAWMDEHTSLHLRNSGKKVLPIAYVNCNFSPFDSQIETSLNYYEVETLFHELGHALHHTLTKITCLPVSGIAGVPWDAVELPSQFFENWIWYSESVDCFSEHYLTQEKMPFEMVQNLLQSKNFLSAMQMLRQLEFSMLDIQLHLQEEHWESTESIDSFVENIRKPFQLFSIPDYTQFYPTFSHVFTGEEYAAGYYSYKWAEVLSSDCFSLFKEKGVFDSNLSYSFLSKLLSQGGSQDFMDLFKNFRGQEPSTDSLLQDLEISNSN